MTDLTPLHISSTIPRSLESAATAKKLRPVVLELPMDALLRVSTRDILAQAVNASGLLGVVVAWKRGQQLFIQVTHENANELADALESAAARLRVPWVEPPPEGPRFGE